MPQLAENRRTSLKATIKRGSAQARSRMRRLDRSSQDLVEAMYRRAAKDLEQIIEGYAGSDGSIRLEVLQQLLGQVNRRLDQLSVDRDQLLDDVLAQSAQLGVNPYTQTGQFFTRAADDALNFVVNFVHEDGLQLSDRIWRLDNGARQLVGNAIQSAVIQGKSASQAATDFLTRGEEIPRDVAQKMGINQAGRITRAAADQLLRSDGNPRKAALRVFRTEMNRAHGEAYMLGGEDHPDFGGWRFLLSPRHPRTDICDMHASVNRYGLGPGIYPSREKCPWPAHPDTLSFVEIVFDDEIDLNDKKGKQDRISWLKNQTPGVQEAVLGSRKKRAALERNLLKENQINTPWKALKKHYTRKGIDVDKLVPITAEQAGLVSSSRNIETTPAGAPVSAALQIQAHKSVSKHVVEVIDGVHGDGRLPSIPIKNSPSNASYYGAYYFTRAGDAVQIKIRAGGDHKDLTLVHEIGHFIDHKGIPGREFSSETSAIMDKWREAVDRSSTIKRLRGLLEGPDVLGFSDGHVHRVKNGYLKYLTDYDEIWARSYAQWITLRSSDSVLRKQLVSLVEEAKMDRVWYPVHWDDDDFNEIAEAIDEIMRDLQWM